MPLSNGQTLLASGSGQRARSPGQVVDLQVDRVEHEERQDRERDVLGDELEPETVCTRSDVSLNPARTSERKYTPA